jgi:hypothetical protein
MKVAAHRPSFDCIMTPTTPLNMAASSVSCVMSSAGGGGRTRRRVSFGLRGSPAVEAWAHGECGWGDVGGRRRVREQWQAQALFGDGDRWRSRQQHTRPARRTLEAM